MQSEEITVRPAPLVINQGEAPIHQAKRTGRPRVRMTRGMKKAETLIGKPLSATLPRLLTDHKLVDVAEMCGTSKATLSYWMLKFGIEVHRVALSPGDRMTIERAEVHEDE